MLAYGAQDLSICSTREIVLVGTLAAMHMLSLLIKLLLTGSLIFDLY